MGREESPAPGIGYYDPDDGSGGRKGARSGKWHPARWWADLWNVRDRCGAFWTDPDGAVCRGVRAGFGWGRLVLGAGRPSRAEDRDAQLRREFDAYLEAAYLDAERATAGQLVKPKYRAGRNQVDPRRFFWRDGPAPMYAASEELQEFWGVGEFRRPKGAGGASPPLTFTEWRRQHAGEAPPEEQAPRRRRYEFHGPLDDAA